MGEAGGTARGPVDSGEGAWAAEIYRVASDLRTRFGDPGERRSFTHIPTDASPTELLYLLRSSALAQLVAHQTGILSHPAVPWYGPLELVTAADKNASGIRLTASTWPPDDAELTLAIRYHQDLRDDLGYDSHLAYAQQVWNLSSRPNGLLSLTRHAYAEQRAETGYEGDRRLDFEPTDERIRAFLHVVRSVATPA